MNYTNVFNGYQGFELVTVRGLSLGVNLPPALKQRFKSGSEEVACGLPPYCPVELGVVDEYEGAPEHWMRGSAKEGSFFFPTAEGRGLWLDFNMNKLHKYHVAVVISIQGVNAVTGQKLVGFAPRLERYDKKCPVHNEDFGHDRFCAKCGFKWPAQNYLADTGTPEGLFWLDGFRNQEGQVRQFTFTPEELKRGVAQNLIGKERVFAVGVAFFLSKTPRPKPVQKSILRGAGSSGHPPGFQHYHGGPLKTKTLGQPMGLYKHSGDTVAPQALWIGDHSSANLVTQDDGSKVTVTFSSASGDESQALYSAGVGELPAAPAGIFALRESDGTEEALETVEEMLDAGESVSSINEKLERINLTRERVRQVQEAKKLEVAAGARIDQQVYPDPEPLDFWRDEPEAIIYLNYADEATVQTILGSPRIDLTAGGEGFLKDVPVGDPPTSAGSDGT